MSEILDTLLIPMLIAAVTAVPGTVWYAAQRWIVRRGIDLFVQMAVSKVAVEHAHPLKLQNSENPEIRRYDLLPEQAKDVMEVAKREVYELARKHDEGKAWYQPAIAPKVVKQPTLLEQKIEGAVQTRKKRKYNARTRRYE